MGYPTYKALEGPYYPVLWYWLEDSGPGDRTPTFLVIIDKVAELAVVICTEEGRLMLDLSIIHEERPQDYQDGTAFLFLYTDGLRIVILIQSLDAKT